MLFVSEEDILFQEHRLTKAVWLISGIRSIVILFLLHFFLPLLSLRIWSFTSIHICLGYVDVIGKFDTSRNCIFLYPRGLWFQLNWNLAFAWLESSRNHIYIYTRNHVRWLNEWEWETRSQQNSWIAILERSFHEGKRIAEPLWLWEHTNHYIILPFTKHLIVFCIILLSPLQVFLT